MYNKRSQQSGSIYFFISKNKRGISAIVATVMLILITVAAVGIVWTAIIPMIRDNLDFSSLEGRVTVLDQGYTAYDADKDIVMVQVKRDSDEGVMDRIRLLFGVEGNTYSSSVIAPGSGGTKVYTFDMNGLGVPDTVGVAPIFIVGQREKEGTVMSSIEIQKSIVQDGMGASYEIGKDYFYEMPMNGIVGFWRFNGDATDSVNSNDGVLMDNANINADGELVLDGVVDYVRRDTLDNAPLGSSPRTMMAWIKPSGYNPTNYNGIVVYGRIQAYSGSLLSIKADSRLSMAFWNNDAMQTIGPGVILNEWNHVAFTYAGGATVKFYIDGEFIQEAPTTLGAPNTLEGPLRIGCTDDPGNRCFIGSIDDVMIYNRELSEEEIKAVYDFQNKV